MTAEAPPAIPTSVRPLQGAERSEPGTSLTLGRVLVYLLLIIGLLAMIGPFLWMLLGSFKEQGEFLRTGCPQSRRSTTTRDSSTGWTSRASSSIQRWWRSP